MRYRLVIFDFDGTLHDSLPWFLRVMNDVTARHGVRNVDAGEIETLRGMGAREIISHLDVPVWKVPLIARDMRRLKSEQLGQIPLFDGVGEMLGRLSDRGLSIAVVSSDSEANVRSALGPANAAQVGWFACGASLFGKSTLFRRVLRRAGVEEGEAIAIGDELRDLEAARQAGIAFGGVTWGYTSRAALAAAGAQRLYSSIPDLTAEMTAG